MSVGTTALVVCLGGAVVAHAGYGRQSPPPIVAPRPADGRRIPKEEKTAVELLRHMVQANLAHSFTARELTMNANGQGTEQWVRWAPKMGLRRDSVTPTPGNILIDNYKSSYVYSTRDKRWTQQNSLLPRPKGRVNEVIKSIRDGELKVSLVGQDVVAGRQADIVLVAPSMEGPAPTRKFWIDRATGLRLKSEDIGPLGRTLSTSYYLTIEVDPRIDEHEFEPPTLTPIHERARHYRTIVEARAAGIKVHTPEYLPVGYTLRDIDVGGPNGQRITQRYNNGLTLVSIVETPLAPAGPGVMALLGPTGSGFVNLPRGLRGYIWRDNPSGHNFIILSSLPDEQIKRIADSIR